MQSDDLAALDQFEKHLRAIVGPGLSMPSPPIVFYLKYTKPDDAVRMLAELLDGGESVQDSVGSLVNGYVDSPGTFFGSIVTSRDGTTTMIGGTMTVVADSRLNRLIAQGTASDIDRIENYLKIIDKDTSITSNETYGTSHVIELLHVRASEVAAVIRDAYAGRVSGGTTSGGSTGSRQPNQPRPAQKGQSEAPAKNSNPKQNQQSESKNSTSKAATNKGGGKTARNLEPMMTIAVHEPSNSLVVTAPEQLFKEVEQLAKLIDARSKQFVEIIPTTNGVALERMLLRAFSGRATSSGDRSRTSSGSIAPRSPSPSQKPASRPNSSPVRNKSGR
jgi:type II secretory pathway component GspD/PulD (secretin)